MDTNRRAVTQFWIGNGLKRSTVAVYCRWIRIFECYCDKHRLEALPSLTQSTVQRFAQWYAGKRRIHRLPVLESARSALHAYSSALAALDISVPPWKPITPPPLIQVPLIREFIEYRRRHCGVSSSTLQQDQVTSLELWEFLRQRQRTCQTVRLPDVDAFVVKLRRRMGVAAVAARLCSVRAWLRFLHASGRLRFDLASSVAGPSLKPNRYPPKALPWAKVQRILRAVDRSTPMGCRDYTMLLLMSLYGLGGAEVVGLCLEDINWHQKTLRICRPKTQTTFLLPLLPAAARALASYLEHSRPKPCLHRHVFLRSVMPYQPFPNSTAIAHMLTKYGLQAGVTTGPLGSHVLRHSHATRQVELGTPLKVVGDLLGHRFPETTSRYTHSAVRRLRDLPIPLPHG